MCKITFLIVIALLISQGTSSTVAISSDSSPHDGSYSSDPPSNSQLVQLGKVRAPGQTFGNTLQNLSPKLNQPISTEESITSDVELDEQELIIENKIKEFNPPPLPDPNLEKINEKVDKIQGKDYLFEFFSSTSQTNQFLHTDFSYSNIFPGSVVKSSFLKGVLDGTESQVPVPAGSKYKNPKISIVDQSNAERYFQGYIFSNVSKAISKAIRQTAQKNIDYTIYFQMGTTDDLSQKFQPLGFNRALLKKLGIQKLPGTPFTTNQKKLIFLFTKPIATFNVEIKSYAPKQFDNPFNTFYSANLTEGVIDMYTPSWWGPNNPPVYIDSITYGSIIVLTVDYTKKTEQLYKQFQQQVENGPDEAQKVLRKIATQPSLKIFSRGPFSSIQLKAIIDGSWLNKFITVPANPSTSGILYPLLYRIRDFGQQNFEVINQFNFTKVTLNVPLPPPPPPPKYNFSVNFTDILNQAPVQFIVETLEGNVVCNLYFYCPITFNFTSYLNKDEMIVKIRPLVSYKMRQKVKAGFIVNQVYTPKLKVDCPINCQVYDAGVYLVKRKTGQIEDY